MKKKRKNIRKKEKRMMAIFAIAIVVIFFMGVLLLEKFRPGEAFEVIEIEQGLQITGISTYSGVFWEDGSGEEVEDVMQITLYNPTVQDLQYVTIEVEYKKNTLCFSATNIPSGESVLLLEENRQGLPQDSYVSVRASNIAFFEQPMSVREDVLKITGMNGAMNVENISGEDIREDIFIYYKKYENDIYNGGITYRVRLAGGLERESIAQITTEHYSPEDCKIIDVTGME